MNSLGLSRIEDIFYKFFKDKPLTFKLVLLTITAGLMIGWVMDFFNSLLVKDILHKEITEKLQTQALEDRQSFNNYISAYNQTAKLLVSLGIFEKYISTNIAGTTLKQPNRVTPAIKYYTTNPEWLPKPSFIRTFIHVRIALLIDGNDKVREVFNGDSLTIPRSLLYPSNLMLETSDNQSYMTMIDDIPYILASESLIGSKGEAIARLMLVSPVDKEFLRAAIINKTNDSIVALLQGEKTPKVLVSNDVDLIKPGTVIKDLSERYLIATKIFFDYGSFDLYLQFASFLSTEKERMMISDLVRTERLRNMSSTLIYIILFSILMYLLTRRINKVSLHIQDFSLQALGIELSKSKTRGDEMFMLEEKFNMLAKEVILSREEIQRNTEELEEKVRERTSELKTSAIRLEEMNEELKTITYIFSHDIRAPLVNLMGFVSELKLSLNELEMIAQECSLRQNCSLHSDEKIQQDFTTLLKKDIPEALDIIYSSSQKINYLNDTLLKFSRLGFVQLEFIKIDMDALLSSILNQLTYQITSNKINIIRTESLPEIMADKTSIEQIIGNILENAIKYLAVGRQGIIEISSSSTNNETIFHIKDNGRGIPSIDNDKVFAVFRRGGLADGAGEGMGLSYAKTLIRRHNGRIWFESIVDHGTTFSFSIPKRI